MQANNGTMTGAIAQDILKAGHRQLLGGVHQPPIREGALRVMHKFDQLEGVKCVSCG